MPFIMSCSTALISLSDNISYITFLFSEWRIEIDKGETSLTVFLDVKKAFDTADHEILLNKLNYHGISGVELQSS